MLRPGESTIIEILKQVKSKPNNTQLGVASYATATLLKHDRIMFPIAGGYGKGRIIATTALNILKWYNTPRVHIVTSSAALMNRDKAEFDDYFLFGECEDKIEYHCDIKF
jgi:hypothetical protein